MDPDKTNEFFLGGAEAVEERFLRVLFWALPQTVIMYNHYSMGVIRNKEYRDGTLNVPGHAQPENGAADHEDFIANVPVVTNGHTVLTLEGIINGRVCDRLFRMDEVWEVLFKAFDLGDEYEIEDPEQSYTGHTRRRMHYVGQYTSALVDAAPFEWSDDFRGDFVLHIPEGRMKRRKNSDLYWPLQDAADEVRETIIDDD